MISYPCQGFKIHWTKL